jgi:hypothetical protein
MVRMQVQLTDEQSRILKMMALEQGVSVAEFISQSIDAYIGSTNRLSSDERRQRALAIVGIAGSGQSDLAVEHDRYLAEAYGKHGE